MAHIRVYQTERLVNQPNNIISNPSITKHILIIKETTQDAFKGISKLYQYRTPEKYKFEYKIIVLGQQNKKTIYLTTLISQTRISLIQPL